MAQKHSITSRRRECTREEPGEKNGEGAVHVELWAGQSFRFGLDDLANTSGLPGQA
jgi:hypothetical protein